MSKKQKEKVNTPSVEEVVVKSATEVIAPAKQVQQDLQPVIQAVKEGKKIYKVKTIVQKLPRGYRLLLEDGQIVKVGKDQYKKGQETVEL